MISAVISDLDGTLLETEELKALSHARAVRELRPEVSERKVVEAYAADLVGRSRREVATEIARRFALEATLRDRPRGPDEEPWETLVRIRHDIYESMLDDPELLASKRYPHNIDLLCGLKDEGYPLALATMSYLHQVERILRVLGLEDLFAIVVTADDISRGKPDPEIDLLAAERLRVPPEEILVLEDSAAGIRAAMSAGMAVVAVPTAITARSVRAAGAPEARWIVGDPARLPEVIEARIADAGGPG